MQIEREDGDEGWFISTVRGWRNRSESKHSPNSPTAGGGVLHSSTQAKQRGEVSNKIDGQKIQRKWDSATGNHPRRGLTNYATRSSSKRAGTCPSQSETIKRRRTVKQIRGAPVDSGISMCKVALMIFIYILRGFSTVYNLFTCNLRTVYLQSTNTGRRLSQLEGGLAGSGCSIE